MEFLFLYVVVPAAVCFLLQSIACHKADRGILRHGVLIFPVALLVLGMIEMFSEDGEVFAGLSVLEAFLDLSAAFCCVLGYGAAWGVYFVMRKVKRRKQEK